jgi:hypothetical protein
MFICLECGKTFDEPVVWYEKHGLDTPPYERWVGSPCCHADYEDACFCENCGEAIPEHQNAYGLCAKCENKALEQFKYFLNNEFTEAEREYLDACIEGCGITHTENIKAVLA